MNLLIIHTLSGYGYAWRSVFEVMGRSNEQNILPQRLIYELKMLNKYGKTSSHSF